MPSPNHPRPRRLAASLVRSLHTRGLILLALQIIALPLLMSWVSQPAAGGALTSPASLSQSDAARAANSLYLPLLVKANVQAASTPQSLATPGRRPPATSTPTPTQARPATYYVDGAHGSDGNNGSLNAPWLTIQHAISTIHAGDTVIIRQGIYRTGNITFGPAGVGFENRTTFKAYPGERVIITRPDNLPPYVWMQDYVRVESLWFGGSPWDKAGIAGQFQPGGSPIGRGKQIVNCTIFGANQGINIGSSENLLIQGNRFVHTGSGQYSHGIYLAGGYLSGSQSQHIIVDGNILIKGEGWALHGWHYPHSMILTRNFIAYHNYGLVLGNTGGTTDHLVANNIIWAVNPGGGGAGLQGDFIDYFNNVHGPGVGIYSSTSANSILNKNAFFGTSGGPKGTNAFLLNNADVGPQLGLAAPSIEAAISALDQSFNGTVDQIYADTTIEPNFAILKNIAVPASSSLYHSGQVWQDTLSTINVGADAPAPADEGVFWKLFRDLGLRDFNSSYVQIYPPSIAAIAVVPSTTGATLTWSTNELADSKVSYAPSKSYSLSTPYANSAYVTGAVTNHSVTLSGLTACTLYHYRVRSRDSNSLESVSADLTFTTGCP